MKKWLSVAALAIMLTCVVLTVKSNKLNESSIRLIMDCDIEALTYSNEKPGPDGERHPQAVQCASWWGWTIKAGCCYGWEDCYFNGCGSANFSCDGVHW